MLFLYMFLLKSLKTCNTFSEWSQILHQQTHLLFKLIASLFFFLQHTHSSRSTFPSLFKVCWLDIHGRVKSDGQTVTWMNVSFLLEQTDDSVCCVVSLLFCIAIFLFNSPFLLLLLLHSCCSLFQRPLQCLLQGQTTGLGVPHHAFLHWHLWVVPL